MERPLTKNIIPGTYLNLKDYKQVGGYSAIDKAFKSMAPGEVTNQVKASNLLGRGGAGFPTGVKWSLIPMDGDKGKHRYLVCNADEMEPGTFKDRYLLEGNPHQLIEGMIISAYAIQAEKPACSGVKVKSTNEIISFLPPMFLSIPNGISKSILAF